MHDTQKGRAIGVFCILFFVYVVIVVRLYYVQVVDHLFYMGLGSRQYHVTVTQLPSRAPILDRNGTFLAMNKDIYTAFILPNRIVDYDAVTQFLSKEFPAALTRLLKNPDKQFLYVKRRLTPEQIEAITQSGLSDIHILQEPGRFYPLGVAASPLVGSVTIDNHGLGGIELLCDATLSGIASTYSLEKDARSNYFYFEKTKMVDGVDGAPVTLTIDADLQFMVHQELCATVDEFKAVEGAVIIMDPTTGEVRAMTKFPSPDFNSGGEAVADEKNSIVTDSYELGSVIKIFASLAALEEGVVTLDERIDCRSQKTAIIDGRRINTTVAHGVLPFIDVVAKSNNIGMAIVAKRVGESLYDHYKAVGFGSKTGIEFPGEVSGFVNHPRNWSKQSIISLSYGYELSVTLLQLASAFAMIANDGITVQPTLILNPAYARDTYNPVKIYSDSTIKQIKQILHETTLRGTTQKAGIKGYNILSKTGTANVLVDGQYDPNRNLFTCAGIVEQGSYKRVIVVFVKEANQKDLFAATVAAPLFERVAERMLIHDRIVN